MAEWTNNLTEDQIQEVERQFAIYAGGTQEVIPENGLKQKIAKSIRTNTPLKIKLGLDPSAPDVHIGHTVVLNKMRQFQDNGHIVQLIIGDFTGKIGDPTGKSVARKQLTDEEVKHNARTYFEQFGKVLRQEKVELFYNSKWLKNLNLEDVIHLAGSITVARLLERNDFSERLSAGKPISLHEFFYPLMQGYDSVMLESDIELGGTDQHFNVLMGRGLQEHYGKEKQVVIMMPLLEGLDGQDKMSKSKKNYIGIDENPNEMFGKTMSIPDELMMKYFELATDLSLEEKQDIANNLADGSLHPRDAKMLLGRTLVRMYHGEEEAQKADAQFKAIFQKGGIPEEIPVVRWKGSTEVSVVQLLVELKMLNSKSEVRRMIANGGVKINGSKVANAELEVSLTEGLIVGIGKRKFIKIELG